MDKKLLIGGAVALAAVVGGAFVFVYVNTREDPLPFQGGRQLTAEELTRATPPPDLDVQAAVERLGGKVGRDGATAPIHEVDLAGRPATDADLDVLRGLTFVQRIDLAGTKVTDAGLAPLAGCKHLAALDLSLTRVTGRGLRALHGLADLRTLVLTGSDVSDAGLAELGDGRPGSGDLYIDLSGTAVTAAGVGRLRAWKPAGLNLRGTRLTADVVPVLDTFPDLRTLIVTDTPLTVADVGRLNAILRRNRGPVVDEPIGPRWGLVDLKEWPRLFDEDLGDDLNSGEPLEKVLNVPGSPFSDADLREVAALEDLEVLNLADTDVTGAGLEALAGHRLLRAVLLDRTPLTDDALKHLADLPRLESLSLRHTGVTDAGLAAVGRLRTLNRLDLTGTKVTDAGLPALAGLNKLRVLTLSGTAVGDAGLKHLAGLKSLRLVTLTGTKVTAEGVRALKAAIPGCTVATTGRPPDEWIRVPDPQWFGRHQ